jgi:hypothetical protein
LKTLKALNKNSQMEFYKPKKASSITQEDTKFSLIGKVEDVGENFFILSDETGKVKISGNFKVEKGSLIRVFCSRSEEEIIADFIQNMEGLDLELWKKAESLYLRLI